MSIETDARKPDAGETGASGDIQTICVVGAGLMGQQIALLAAISGFEVYCADTSTEALRKAEDFVAAWLPKQKAKGRVTDAQIALATDNLHFINDLDFGAKNADMAIEAAVEELGVKRAIFAQLDRIAPPHAILATNSSYLVSSKIADATSRPDKVLNMHFFNPALIMKTVEVVQGPHVSDETVEKVMAVSRALGKIPAKVNKEIYGFLCNRIFSVITKEACYMLDQGIASVEDIDNAVKGALGHPMGPLELLDMTGIDLEYRLGMERYRETGNLADKPSPSLVERYARGDYGRKTGKGFYDYEV
ncbi:MAG: 3-hydroxyacyl-CoA dehydrogenase family protein [Clostridiales Family XIII bacterium]|jgi:3-hydroxybutyryl-CoA dehydrogenase|nr:3-hydroxyacyl-CoA dehydrogenase family protein [Clostridiales Family XIII bacterium]